MLRLVETQSVCSHAVLLHGKRAGGIVSLSLMAENEDACFSPRRAGFSRHPDLAFQMSEYSPRLFVACKQGSCTVFVNVSAASRRVESVKLLVPLGGWAGVQGHYPFQTKWRSHGRAGLVLINGRRDVGYPTFEISVYAEKKKNMSEWSLIFQVHGMARLKESDRGR